MFRRHPSAVTDIVQQLLRRQGLETPLMQRRVVAAWDEAVGPAVARYTGERFIKNQTLMVKITNPALRADLAMVRTRLRDKLNAMVGAPVIADIKIY